MKYQPRSRSVDHFDPEEHDGQIIIVADTRRRVYGFHSSTKDQVRSTRTAGIAQRAGDDLYTLALIAALRSVNRSSYTHTRPTETHRPHIKLVCNSQNYVRYLTSALEAVKVNPPTDAHMFSFRLDGTPLVTMVSNALAAFDLDIRFTQSMTTTALQSWLSETEVMFEGETDPRFRPALVTQLA
jgi:hypothetical protein